MSCLPCRCRPGAFNLQPHNPAGCSSCFCYGHSKVCVAAAQFREHHILSDFRQGKKWSPQPPPRALLPAQVGWAGLLWGHPVMRGVERRGSLRPQPRRLPQAHTVAMPLCALLHPQHLPAPRLPSSPCLLPQSLVGAGEGWVYGSLWSLRGIFISSSDPLVYPSAGDPGLVPWPPFIEHLLYA